jgi:hypothetical protein
MGPFGAGPRGIGKFWNLLVLFFGGGLSLAIEALSMLWTGEAA